MRMFDFISLLILTSDRMRRRFKWEFYRSERECLGLMRVDSRLDLTALPSRLTLLKTVQNKPDTSTSTNHRTNITSGVIKPAQTCSFTTHTWAHTQRDFISLLKHYSSPFDLHLVRNSWDMKEIPSVIFHLYDRFVSKLHWQKVLKWHWLKLYQHYKCKQEVKQMKIATLWGRTRESRRNWTDVT